MTALLIKRADLSNQPSNVLPVISSNELHDIKEHAGICNLYFVLKILNSSEFRLKTREWLSKNEKILNVRDMYNKIV